MNVATNEVKDHIMKNNGILQTKVVILRTLTQPYIPKDHCTIFDVTAFVATVHKIRENAQQCSKCEHKNCPEVMSH